MRITFDHEMKNVDIRVLLQVAYHASPRFLEIDIDIGSSTVANNIVRFVLGYVVMPVFMIFHSSVLKLIILQICSNPRG